MTGGHGEPYCFRTPAGGSRRQDCKQGTQAHAIRTRQAGNEMVDIPKPSLFTCSAPITHKHMCPVLIPMHRMEMSYRKKNHFKRNSKAFEENILYVRLRMRMPL